MNFERIEPLDLRCGMGWYELDEDWVSGFSRMWVEGKRGKASVDHCKKGLYEGEWKLELFSSLIMSKFDIALVLVFSFLDQFLQGDFSLVNLNSGWDRLDLGLLITLWGIDLWLGFRKMILSYHLTTQLDQIDFFPKFCGFLNKNDNFSSYKIKMLKKGKKTISLIWSS